MGLKRISLAFFIAAAAVMLFIASTLERKEVLELCYKGNSGYFTKYSCKGINILTAGQSESDFRVHILGITANKLELIGTLKCKDGEYAAAVLRDRINLYTAAGKLKGYYSTWDTGNTIISCCIADIDGDADEELLAIEGDGKKFYGHKLVMLSYDKGLKKSYEREFKELNPWKVQICDVDGDNRIEIALGVYKEANFHPVMAKRPFLYLWDRGDIVPMWRGSRLSRPFEDYIFTDIDADEKDELISVERLSDGKVLVNAYRWAGFGFESIAESMPYEDIQQLVKQNDGKEKAMIEVENGKEHSWLELEKINERLVEKAEFNRVIHIKK